MPGFPTHRLIIDPHQRKALTYASRMRRIVWPHMQDSCMHAPCLDTHTERCLGNVHMALHMVLHMVHGESHGTVLSEVCDRKLTSVLGPVVETQSYMCMHIHIYIYV